MKHSQPHALCVEYFERPDENILVLDSETFYEKIIGDIAGQYGKKYTKEVRARILGTPEMMTSQLAVELMELPLTPEEFFLRMRKGVEAELHNPPLLPGTNIFYQMLNSRIEQ